MLLNATTCFYPPPCAKIRPGSIFFVGTVLDGGVPEGNGREGNRLVRVQVSESLMGLDPTFKEVTVRVEGDSLRRGHTLLFDADRNDDGTISPAICGVTSDVTSADAKDLLEYLKLRKSGKTTASLKVFVRDDLKPVRDVQVQLIGGRKSSSTKTGSDGNAEFPDLVPGTYQIRASREHYQLDADHTSDSSVDVIEGECAIAFVHMRAQGSVSGFLRDVHGVPVQSFTLELNEIPGEREDGQTGWYSTTTDSNGEFRFESVSPGRYHLGTNLLDYMRTSPGFTTYYPGQRSRNGAVPVEVKLGEETSALIYTLPKFGKERDLRIRVVNEDGQPVQFADVKSENGDGDDFGGYQNARLTDANGTVVFRGFEDVRYQFRSILRIQGPNHSKFTISEPAEVVPGEGPANLTLILKRLK